MQVLSAAGVYLLKVNYAQKELWNMFKVNNKDTRTKSIDAVAVSFGINQTQKEPPAVFYKKKLF